MGRGDVGASPRAVSRVRLPTPPLWGVRAGDRRPIPLQALPCSGAGGSRGRLAGAPRPSSPSRGLRSGYKMGWVDEVMDVIDANPFPLGGEGVLPLLIFL